MAFIYSSNSPHFLDYIASCKTKSDVLNDPELCVLLNDPHIKDNMELAFKARAADYGSYADKVDFVGFFLANGPELDTDTIMHYRKKILLNYTYSRIAREEFGDIAKVDELRINTYGKDTTASAEARGEDDGNCFKNPCDYLQPISAMMGMLGDSENFKTIANIFARGNKEAEEDKKKEEKKKAEKEEKKKGKKTDTKKEEKSDEDRPSHSVWGAIRKHAMSKIIPAFNEGYRVMVKNMGLKAEELKEKAKEANMEKETQTIGDSTAEPIAENIAPAVKMNIFANMGDCARLWEHLRRLNVYNPNQNAKGPIDDSAINTNKTVQGTPRAAAPQRTDNSLKAKPAASTTSAAGAGTTGKTKTEIVIERLVKHYSKEVDVREAWEHTAWQYGWKDYDQEMAAHLAKCKHDIKYHKEGSEPGYVSIAFPNPYDKIPPDNLAPKTDANVSEPPPAEPKVDTFTEDPFDFSGMAPTDDLGDLGEG